MSGKSVCFCKENGVVEWQVIDVGDFIKTG
jgi:hypothetical protein